MGRQLLFAVLPSMLFTGVAVAQEETEPLAGLTRANLEDRVARIAHNLAVGLKILRRC